MDLPVIFSVRDGSHVLTLPSAPPPPLTDLTRKHDLYSKTNLVTLVYPPTPSSTPTFQTHTDTHTYIHSPVPPPLKKKKSTYLGNPAPCLLNLYKQKTGVKTIMGV